MLHRQTANAGLLALPPMTAQIATALGPALDEPTKRRSNRRSFGAAAMKSRKNGRRKGWAVCGRDSSKPK
jgi:hypothetical protein